MPRRDPSAAPPSSTTIGCSVNGTGVNGSGMLTCAAAIVRTVTNRTAAARNAAESSARADDGLQQRAAGDTVRYECVMGSEFYCMRTALTIAGSDSGGGAGIQADLKTFAACGVYGTSAITAVTAQNTLGVTAWEAVSTELVIAQIEAVGDDLPPAAVKTGMLATAAIVEAVAATIAELDLPNLVVDPVMIAKGGDRLLREDAVAAISAELLKRAEVVTPNVPEAEVLTGIADRHPRRHARRRQTDPRPSARAS